MKKRGDNIKGKLFWIQIPGIYVGKRYEQRQIIRLGDYLNPKTLKKLVHSGHIVQAKREDVEHCPSCKAGFVRENSVQISQIASEVLKDEIINNLGSEHVGINNVPGLRRLIKYLGQF